VRGPRAFIRGRSPVAAFETGDQVVDGLGDREVSTLPLSVASYPAVPPKPTTSRLLSAYSPAPCTE